MRVTPIRNPISGEQIVGVSPEMGLQVEADWQRRINPFTGRNLSHTALEAEQNQRAARLALSGQALSSGVVSGLEVMLEREVIPASGETPEQVNYYYQIEAGMGLASSGEDVIVMRPTRVEVGSVPVYTLVSLLGGDTTEPDAGTGTLQPRAVGPTLREFIRDVALPETFPRVGVLVLQPISLGVVGEYDPNDPCEEDPANYAYEDQQWVDGCRLLLYTWPSEWRLLPEASGARWQNRIAYTIFSAELTLGAEGILPWEGVGVPIALVGFSNEWEPLFVDRYAVVRDGGKYARRASLIQGTGDPFMWQARIRQFAEQAIATYQFDVPQLAAQFRYLPPVSILPKEAVDPITHLNTFFPGTYDIDIAPVPLEQLDIVFESSAPLQPFDTFSADQVRVLVPVPQQVFEPGLLVTETISPEFQQTIDEFIIQRNEALRRRTMVRAKHSALVKAITGIAPTYPSDVDQVEAGEFEIAPTYTGGAHRSANLNGMHQHFFTNATDLMSVTDFPLFVWVYLDAANPPSEIMLQWNVDGWEHRAYWGADIIQWGIPNTASRFRVGDLPKTGRWLRLEIPPDKVGLVGTRVNGMAFTLFNGRAAWGRTGFLDDGEESVWFEDALPEGAQPHSDFETWEFVPGGDVPTPLEASYETQIQPDGPPIVQPIVSLKESLEATPLANDTTAPPSQIDEIGLEAYIKLLDAKIAKADDTVDFGFTRIHTDIYRIRQLVLNTEAATRLAISPTLASIAKGESAVATKEQISTFYDRLKSTSVELDGDSQAASGSAMMASLGSSNLFSSSSSTTIIPTSLETVRFTPLGGRTEALEGIIGTIGTVGTGTTGTIGRDILQPIDDASRMVDLSGGVFDRGTGTGHIPKPPDVIDVIEQPPVIGSVVIRTTSIAERIEAPKAPEAKDFSASTHHDIVRNIVGAGDTVSGLDIALDDLVIPVRTVFTENNTKKVKIENVSFDTFRNPPEGSNPLGSLLNPEMLNGVDEAEFFSVGVDVLDNAVAALRVVEGRIQAYKQARASCQTTLNQLRTLVSSAGSRLNVIGSDLAEARHDVSVARALKAEEESRLRAINERRQSILREFVEFIVFCRPRATDMLLQTPVRAINPGFTAAPVPQCLSQQIPVPEALRSMVELLKDVPLKWFTVLPPLLQKLDHVQVLQDTLAGAKLRAQVQNIAPMVAPQQSGDGLIGQAITKVFAAQQQVVTQYRAQVAQANITTISTQSWSGAVNLVAEALSPADLISGRHGRSDLSRLAADEMDMIAKMAGCLYAAFSEVLPSIRLDWAERLSQYDAPVNLRNLSSLARWGEIDYIQRREMQAMVDWLFQRIDNRQAQATDIMNDIIRICILLASHAPVNQIVTGHLPKPAVVRPGSRLDVFADISKLRVGMHVLVYSGNEIAARGIVEDMGVDGIATRVTQTAAQTVNLAQNARVEFVAAENAVLNAGMMMNFVR